MFGLFSKAGSQDGPATGAARRRQSLGVEALEDRTALSTVYVASGQLHISGTEAGDDIKIRQFNYTYPTRYAVYENGVWVGSFSGDQLYNNEIVFYGNGGNDRIENVTGLRLIAYGGWGYDTLIGGWSHDFLVGEGDNDVLVGREGNDTLIGGWYGYYEWAGFFDHTSDYLEGGPGVDYFRKNQPGDTARDSYEDYVEGYDVEW